MGRPPLAAGAVQVTFACPLPKTAATLVDDPGTVAGTTGPVGLERSLSPMAFVATTVNVYVVPLTRPEKASDVEPAAAVNCAAPGDAVTVYPVMLLPPLSSGAFQVTVAERLPNVAATFV